MKASRYGTLAGLALLLLALLSCAGSAKPLPEALAFPHPASAIEDHGAYIAFTPQAPARLGFIFYPGAKVDPMAYAPLLSSLADQGYLVLMPRMPLDLAIFGQDRALALMKAHPEISIWAIGGHSLGGVAAAMFAKKARPGLAGIAFLASFPDSGSDLSASGLSVLCVSASQDGLSTPAKIEAAKRLLPPDSQYRVIQGGNHAQFGWYGNQSGDKPASISREDQQGQLRGILGAWLDSLQP